MQQPGVDPTQLLWSRAAGRILLFYSRDSNSRFKWSDLADRITFDSCLLCIHAAELRLVIGLGVAAVVVGALVEPLLGPSDWYLNQKTVGFVVAGIFLFFVLVAGLPRIIPEEMPINDVHNIPPQPGYVHPTTQYTNNELDGQALKERMPANEVNHAQPQAGNVQPNKEYVKNDFDIQALKEALKNRRQHFGQ
jgi:hypothetical protein